MTKMFPNFDNSIINVMASLTLGLSGYKNRLTDYPPSPFLDSNDIRSAKNVVLFIIDGLGADIAHSQTQNPFLINQYKGNITSVFPSATATAISSLTFGVAPNKHAIVGWNTWIESINEVMTILPFHPLVGEHNYPNDTFSIADCIDQDTFFESIDRPSVTFQPAEIVRSHFSRYATRGAKQVQYQSLNELIDSLVSHIEQTTEPSFYYIYWPYYDSICHKYGVNSRESNVHYSRIIMALSEFTARLDSNAETLMIATADHGMINCTSEDILSLEDYPDIRACLSQPLSGEPRVIYCHTKAEQKNHFEALATDLLSNYCDIYPTIDILQNQFFGRSANNKNLAGRIGDYTLVMKEHYLLYDPKIKEQSFNMIGIHGGVTPQEMLVPLFVWSK